MNLRRGLITAFLIFICFLLQCTVFRALAFGGIVPNLLIVLAASFGFMRGEKTGLLIGFVCGLLVDIFFGNTIGFYALLYMYIGYMNGKFCIIFYPQDIKLPIALILGSDLFYGFICYVILFLLRSRFDFGYYFREYHPAGDRLYDRRHHIFIPAHSLDQYELGAHRTKEWKEVCLTIYWNV